MNAILYHADGIRGLELEEWPASYIKKQWHGFFGIPGEEPLAKIWIFQNNMEDPQNDGRLPYDGQILYLNDEGEEFSAETLTEIKSMIRLKMLDYIRDCSSVD